jgi:hypothetical protein
MMRRTLSTAVILAVAATSCSDDGGPSAIVWRSVVDPQRVTADAPAPEAAVDGVRISVDAIVETDAEEPLCADALQFSAVPVGDLRACLLVQYRVDVDADVAGAVTLRASRARATGGSEVTAMAAETLVAYGGTVDALGSALFANVDPDVELLFDVTVGDEVPDIVEILVPDQQFEQIDWPLGAVADDRL